MMALYALWRGGECLANVRGAEGLSGAQVRRIALDEHERVPLCFGSDRAPYEHAIALRHARVKVYEKFGSTSTRVRHMSQATAGLTRDCSRRRGKQTRRMRRQSARSHCTSGARGGLALPSTVALVLSRLSAIQKHPRSRSSDRPASNVLTSDKKVSYDK